MERKNRVQWKDIWNKYKFVALVAAVGVVFLLWPTGEKIGGGKETEPVARSLSGETEETPLDETEQRMIEILGKISGVGELDLMLTLDKSARQQYVQDGELSYSGPTAAPDDYQRKSETVVLSKGSGQEGLTLEQSVYPVYRGALVVCQGGGDPNVQLAVTQAVSALTGLSSDRITVVKWK